MSAFRSHLMQQFAAAARTQSRPPLALAQIYGDQSNAPSRQSTPSPPPPSPSRRAPSRSAVAAQTTRRASSQHLPPRTSPPRNSLILTPQLPNDGGGGGRSDTFGNRTRSRPRSLSFITATSTLLAPDAADQNAADDGMTNEGINMSPAADLQHSFQTLLRTRRTVSNLTQPDLQTAPPDVLSAAITRAVQCAVEAPNHKRTEPFTFTRLISPSATTEALADVCYHVSVRRMRERQKGSEATLLAEAERKRTRWRNIPAFLVASVGGMPDQVGALESNAKDADGSEYAELPFIPPATERQLEDVSIDCACLPGLVSIFYNLCITAFSHLLSAALPLHIIVIISTQQRALPFKMCCCRCILNSWVPSGPLDRP